MARNISAISTVCAIAFPCQEAESHMQKTPAMPGETLRESSLHDCMLFLSEPVFCSRTGFSGINRISILRILLPRLASGCCSFAWPTLSDPGPSAAQSHLTLSVLFGQHVEHLACRAVDLLKMGVQLPAEQQARADAIMVLSQELSPSPAPYPYPGNLRGNQVRD